MLGTTSRPRSANTLELGVAEYVRNLGRHDRPVHTAVKRISVGLISVQSNSPSVHEKIATQVADHLRESGLERLESQEMLLVLLAIVRLLEVDVALDTGAPLLNHVLDLSTYQSCSHLPKRTSYRGGCKGDRGQRHAAVGLEVVGESTALAVLLVQRPVDDGGDRRVRVWKIVLVVVRAIRQAQSERLTLYVNEDEVRRPATSS